MKRLMAIAMVITVVCFSTTTVSWALGFRNPDQGASATGQGEAFIAQADDASAIYYNPGGLTQIKGTEIMVGSYLTFRDIQFTGLTNEKLDDPAYTAHFYAATDFGTEKWRFGLGVNMPFGNSVDWGDTGLFQYVVTKSSLLVLNMSPTIAYKMNDHLSAGVGLNVYYGDTKLERDVSLSPLPLPDGHFSFDGDGIAVGATVGLLWTLNEQHSVGAVYRSPFEIKFDGTGHLNTIMGEPPMPATAKIKFPQSVAVGYAFRPTKKLKLEADVEWTDWNVLNDVVLNAPGASFDGTTVPFRWESSFFYEVGAQYELNEHWALRAGYIYSENSVPDLTFSPTLPDGNRHVVSIGAGYSAQKFALDIVYQYSLTQDRTIAAGTNLYTPFMDGQWESQGHAIMLSGSLKF